MNQPEFDREVDRLRNHFGDRHYSADFVRMLWQELKDLPSGIFTKIVSEAVMTLSQAKAPLRDDLRKLIAESGINVTRQGWTYFEVADCLRCGGCGWYWGRRPDQAEVVITCEDCEAGRNIMRAPSGVRKAPLKDYPPGTVWIKAGRGSYEHTGEMHPRLKDRLEKLGVRDIARLVVNDIRSRQIPND